MDAIEIRPQAGPQEAFLSSPADIAIYGGAAGGGKSWALLLEPLRHVTTNPEFAAVFFRRNLTQVKNPGGLWDESSKIYPTVGGTPVAHVSEWQWPKGGKVKFGHLEHEATVYDWQGAQIPLICFDELTHFSQTQFFYLLSRNRSMCGVRPYIRATTNPDADSWVAEFLSWWIDQDSGFPIPERAGVLRWFIRVNDSLVWGNSQEELIERNGADVLPKSVTFIPAKIQDNQKLMQADPGYMANLQALDTVQRERLLGGNWKIRPLAGLFFRDEWVRKYDPKQIPPNLNVYGASDYGVTDGAGDYTEHGVFGVDPDDNIFVLAWWYGQTDSATWIEEMLDLVRWWKPITWFGEAGPIRRAVEPFLDRRMRERRDYCNLEWIASISDKATRARAIQSRAAMGKIFYPINTPWADRLLHQLGQFPSKGMHDDAVDVMGLIGRGLADIDPASKSSGSSGQKIKRGSWRVA